MIPRNELVRLASGEVTAPDNIGEIPSLKYWMVEGLAAWKARPCGVKYAAKTTNRLLLQRILMPAVVSLQHNFELSGEEENGVDTAEFHSCEPGADGSLVTTRNPCTDSLVPRSPVVGDTHKPECQPLQYINAISHDFADKRLVLWILKLNFGLNRKAFSLPFYPVFRHESI